MSDAILYITNATTKTHDFIFRHPATGQEIKKTIPRGNQKPVFTGPLDHVQKIVEQHFRLGLVPVEAAKASGADLFYTIDEVAQAQTIADVIDINNAQLVEDAIAKSQLSAVGNASLEGEKLQELVVSVVEETKGKTAPLVQRKIQVKREAA